MSRRWLTLTLEWGRDEPAPTTDHPGDAGQLDTMVEHGDHYAGRPELHIGFRHQGDDE